MWGHHQYGAWRLSQDFFRDRADEQTFKPGAAVCAHHDEIGIDRDRLFNDVPGGVTFVRGQHRLS